MAEGWRQVLCFPVDQCWCWRRRRLGFFARGLRLKNEGLVELIGKWDGLCGLGDISRGI